MTTLQLDHRPSPFSKHLGRALVGLLFIISGGLKLLGFIAVAAGLSSKGLPIAFLLTSLAIAVEVGGGLALSSGWKAKQAALILALFVVPAPLPFHAFWAAAPAAYQNQVNHLLKNVTIFGALLMVASFD